MDTLSEYRIDQTLDTQRIIETQDRCCLHRWLQVTEGTGGGSGGHTENNRDTQRIIEIIEIRRVTRNM